MTDTTIDIEAEIKKVLETPELISAIRTLNRIDGSWDYLRNFKPSDGGFMYCKDQTVVSYILQIDNDYPYHSGCSIGQTMRYIEWMIKQKDLFAHFRSV